MTLANIVARMERSENPGLTHAGPDCAEPVIGRRFAPTRLAPSGLQLIYAHKKRLK